VEEGPVGGKLARIRETWGWRKIRSEASLLRLAETMEDGGQVF
jgi:hypothetical protein